MKLKNFHHVIPRKSDTSTFNLSILLDPAEIPSIIMKMQ